MKLIETSCTIKLVINWILKKIICLKYKSKLRKKNIYIYIYTEALKEIKLNCMKFSEKSHD